MKKKHLALFDFDGTITRKDSFMEFVRHAVGAPRFYVGILVMSPLLALFMLKLFPNYRMKEIFLSHFFKNWPESRFLEAAESFSKVIGGIVKTSALERIAWHHEEGHRVVVVSASVDYWLRGWCREREVELIATGMEVEEGKMTGKLSTKNCYGPEKTRRIKETIDLSQYQYIYAYGDSGGDKEMLEMADEPYFRHFN